MVRNSIRVAQRVTFTFTFTFVAVFLGAYSSSVQSGTEVHVGFLRETDFIDRLHTDSIESAALSLAVYDTLLYRDPKTKKFSGLLAKAWKWNTKRDVIDFTLREQVHFHNGELFDADDVVYTINQVIDPANTINFRQRDNSFGFIQSVEKLSDFTVRVRLKKAQSVAEDIFATRLIIWPKDYTRSNGGHIVHRTAPIGTGPYRVAEVSPGSELVLLENEYYFEGPKSSASLERIVVRNVPDVQTQIAELLKGSLDFIWGIPADQSQQLALNPAISVSYGKGSRITFISLNSKAGKDNKLADPKLREVIALSIDKKSIAKYLIGNEAEPLVYLCHPDQAHCINNSQESMYSFDIERANAILKDLGHQIPIVLELITGSGELRKVAEALQYQLGRAGIRLLIRSYTLPAWRNKFLSGESEMSLLNYGGDIYDLSATVIPFFNMGHADYARDQALADHLSSAAESVDVVESDKSFGEALRYIRENVYTIPLFTSPTTFIYRDIIEYDSSALPFPEFNKMKLRNEGRAR